MSKDFINVKVAKELEEENIKKYIVSTDKENSVIGAQILPTCIGILLYSEDKKIASVLNIPSNITGHSINEEANIIMINVYNYLLDLKLLNKEIKYLVIPGASECFYDNGKVKDVSKQLNHMFSNGPGKFTKIKTNKLGLINMETETVNFVFDAKNNDFVTRDYFSKGVNCYLEYNKNSFKKIDKNKGNILLPNYKRDEIDVLNCNLHVRLYKEEKDEEALIFFNELKNKLGRDRAIKIKRSYFSRADTLELKDGEVKLNNIKNGYVICETDKYYDIISNDNFKKYLEYFEFEDISDILKENEKIEFTNRIYIMPDFFDEKEEKNEKTLEND